MKYELMQINSGAETEIDVDTYSIEFTLAIHPTDGIAPNFTKMLVVVSDNNLTGFEVKEQRENAITNYMNLINS